jgi:hypothetical protein
VTAQSVPASAITRISAALDIHAPCHTAQTPPWECAFGHTGDLDTDGMPSADQPAVCMSCTYDDRTVTYPCPTATALGVTSGGGPA